MKEWWWKIVSCISRADLWAHVRAYRLRMPLNRTCNSSVLLTLCRTWGPFLESPETFGRISGGIILSVSSKRRPFEARYFCRCFNFYFICNIWKDQLYRISGSEFYEWLFENFEKRAPNPTLKPGLKLCRWLSLPAMQVIASADRAVFKWGSKVTTLLRLLRWVIPAPVFQPMKTKTKASRILSTRFFQRFEKVTCNCLEFWLVHCTVCSC